MILYVTNKSNESLGKELIKMMELVFDRVSSV